MYTYVMSDLHGNYKVYREMLKMIHFSDEDMLYILGDVVDRGSEPVRLLLDLMQRANIKVIAGNHEVMALECMSFLLREITEESIVELNGERIGEVLDWQQNGGQTTIDGFKSCDMGTRRQLLSFISEMDVYEEIEVCGKNYVMVHAGLENFHPDKPMEQYGLHELVWDRPDYQRTYFQDKYLITGHTPTQIIEENLKPGYIYQANNHIAIDCGCSFPSGRLGCIRLEDMAEFYVEQA